MHVPACCSATPSFHDHATHPTSSSPHLSATFHFSLHLHAFLQLQPLSAFTSALSSTLGLFFFLPAVVPAHCRISSASPSAHLSRCLSHISALKPLLLHPPPAAAVSSSISPSLTSTLTALLTVTLLSSLTSLLPLHHSNPPCFCTSSLLHATCCLPSPSLSALLISAATPALSSATLMATPTTHAITLSFLCSRLLTSVSSKLFIISQLLPALLGSLSIFAACISSS